MSALNAVEKKKAAVEASIEKAGNMLEWNKEAATNAEQKKTEAQKAAMEAERQRKEEQRAAKEAAHLRKIEEQKALAGREGLEAERARVKGELDAVRVPCLLLNVEKIIDFSLNFHMCNFTD